MDNKTFALKLIQKLNIGSDNNNRRSIRLAIEENNMENEVKYNYGASKHCLIFKNYDFVIKWSKDDRKDAMMEVEYYEEAKKEGIAMLFPHTEFFGEINGIQYVLQEKIDFTVNEMPYMKKRKYKRITQTVSNSICRKAYNKLPDPRTGNLWIEMIISIYGKKVCKKFCEFAVKYNINDMHQRNAAYKNDKPILLDFSGYH